MKILVTGATGKLGNLVVKELLKLVPPENISVSVRDINKANGLKEQGIDVRYGDFDKPDTLKEAFKNIDKLLIISTDGDNETRIRQHKTALIEAKKSGVKFIAYTSVAQAETSSLPLAIVHKETEAFIKELGIPYSILRNNWYLENEINNFKEALSTGTWTNSIGQGKVGWALRKDYAKACANLLATDGHENSTYELTRKPISTNELVKTIEKLTSKKIVVNNINEETYSKVLATNGLPEPLIGFLVELQNSIRNNSLNVESNDFEKLTHSSLTPIEESVNEMLETIKNY